MNIPTGGTPNWHIQGYQNKKPQYEYPSLEDFHPLVTYAITISPNPLLRSESLIECVGSVHCDILPLISYGAEYTLRPEISTKSTILHYHGTILFPSREGVTHFYFYNIVKLKSVCTFVIKPIEDDIIWDKYCKKQRLHMKPFLNGNNLRYKLQHSDKSIYIKPVKKRMPTDDDLDKGTPYDKKTNTPSIISFLKK